MRDRHAHNVNLEVAPDVGDYLSPTFFPEGLDNLKLTLLNIKFPLEATGVLFLDVASAANRSCRLRNLNGLALALAGGGWFTNCGERGLRPELKIQPRDLRAAMAMLLPLPQLKMLLTQRSAQLPRRAAPGLLQITR
jgi:hypothetical protein